MKLIVDANILFAALIRQNATFLLLFEKSLEFYAPQYIFDELAEHQDELMAKSPQTPLQFQHTLDILCQHVNTVPLPNYVSWVPEAREISPDPDDADYIALALSLGPQAAIWSNDNRLKSQNRVAILSTTELVELFYKTDPYAKSP